jgi:hypothetical protein
MRKYMRPRSLGWPLVKVAGFWFIFAQGALLLARRFEISPVWFVYFATAAFALQSVVVLLGAFFADGFSWRLFFGAGVCFAVGTGVFSTLPLMEVDYAAGPRWLLRSIGFGEDGSRTAGSTQPVDQLAAAAHLIFLKETKESLAEARRHLLSIPQPAAEYKSAQALLNVAQDRLDEVKIRKDAPANKRAPVEVIASKQTGQGLQVTLRNNSKKSVRNIRYHVSYFRADGWHVVPDKESLIIIEIPPDETWTLELSDKSVAKGLYGSFTVVSWEVVS